MRPPPRVEGTEWGGLGGLWAKLSSVSRRPPSLAVLLLLHGGQVRRQPLPGPDRAQLPLSLPVEPGDVLRRSTLLGPAAHVAGGLRGVGDPLPEVDLGVG